MRALWRAASYPARRLLWWICTPACACRYPYCARPVVGLSVWCRRHTDDILSGRDGWDGWLA